jgi:hypothetical protein
MDNNEEVQLKYYDSIIKLADSILDSEQPRESLVGLIHSMTQDFYTKESKLQEDSLVIQENAEHYKKKFQDISGEYVALLMKEMKTEQNLETSKDIEEAYMYALNEDWKGYIDNLKAYLKFPTGQ